MTWWIGPHGSFRRLNGVACLLAGCNRRALLVCSPRDLLLPPVSHGAGQVVDDKDVDEEALHALFNELDEDKNGTIDYGELKRGLLKLNLHPKKMLSTLA